MNSKVVNQRTTKHKYHISYLYAGKHKLVMKIKQLQTQAIKTAVCMVALQLPCKFSSGQLSKRKKSTKCAILLEKDNLRSGQPQTP